MKTMKEMLAQLAELESNLLTESINEAPEEGEADNEPIKSAVPFNQLVEMIFDKDQLEIGKIALRKVFNKKDLTIREKAIMSEAFTALIPIIANDRTIFNRIDRKKV